MVTRSHISIQPAGFVAVAQAFEFRGVLPRVVCRLGDVPICSRKTVGVKLLLKFSLWRGAADIAEACSSLKQFCK